MHQMMGSEEVVETTKHSNRAPETPDAVSRLPSHLRQEMAIYLRTEAVRRRDRGFAHCSHEFLVAFVASLKSRVVLMPEDDYVVEHEMIPNQLSLLVDGTLEVVSKGHVIRKLQVGDVVGKRWLLQKNLTKPNKFGIRAETICTLITGLHGIKDVANLKGRFPKDMSLLSADRGGTML